MAQNMSIGEIGTGKIIKRKFRWTISLGNTATRYVEDWMVKTAARPNLSFEEIEINHLHEKIWLAGKATWDALSMTILDVKAGDSVHNWIKKVFDFSNEDGTVGNMLMGDPDGSTTAANIPNSYKSDAVLKMFDGQGNTLEIWTLHGCWPQTINWGDLDYSSSDTQDVELTVRYDRALLQRLDQ